MFKKSFTEISGMVDVKTESNNDPLKANNANVIFCPSLCEPFFSPAKRIRGNSQAVKKKIINGSVGICSADPVPGITVSIEKGTNRTMRKKKE